MKLPAATSGLWSLLVDLVMRSVASDVESGVKWGTGPHVQGGVLVRVRGFDWRNRWRWKEMGASEGVVPMVE